MGLKHEAGPQLGVRQLYCSIDMYLKHEATEIIRRDNKMGKVQHIPGPQLGVRQLRPIYSTSCISEAAYSPKIKSKYETVIFRLAQWVHHQSGRSEASRAA